MSQKIYRLTKSEKEILLLGRDDPDIITDYFFRPAGADSGWKFDENFLPEGKWQKTVHHARQTDIVVLGGFGTGKTLGVGMSASVWAITTPNFKFLNVAQKAWQARQMYDAILLNAQGTPFERLIFSQPRRPYPKIEIKFYFDDVLIHSSLEFMSADKNATGILSWEGDWINIDEAGLLDNLEEIVTALGSRLRGSVRGRPRLGRLSMTSNSWDNAYMWYYFDLAAADPENYLSIVVSTRHNKNVTEAQLQKMLARIPEDERERWIDGTRPEGKGKFFNKQAIYRCESTALDMEIEKALKEKRAGYGVEKIYGAGTVYVLTPPRHDEIYVVMGDPGIGKAPGRNAPVLMVWGVPAGFPETPAILRGFWWGDGGGAITPFVNQMYSFINLYNPIIAGVDATGPQKNMAELINIQFASLTGDSDEQKQVTPMDFSGSKKIWYLQALRLFIESGKLRWPKMVTGIRSQLANYDPVRDKKIPQDIVATMAMSAFAIRSYFYVDPSDQISQEDDEAVGPVATSRQYRYPRAVRTARASR